MRGVPIRLTIKFFVKSKNEMKQDPMVFDLHVLCLSFVCGKTFAKEYV